MKEKFVSLSVIKNVFWQVAWFDSEGNIIVYDGNELFRRLSDLSSTRYVTRVVYCKDCRLAEKVGNSMYICKKHKDDWKIPIDFCSDGKPKRQR